MSLLLLFAGATTGQAPAVSPTVPAGRVWRAMLRTSTWEAPERTTDWRIPKRSTEWET